MGVVAEEADESVLWLEFLEETGILSLEKLSAITTEARELVAIFSTSFENCERQQIIRFFTYQITNLLIYQLLYLPN